MEKNPENKEWPNPSELKPKPQPSQQIVKKLGETAIKGTKK